MMTNIILPELGEGIYKATLACWHVKLGESLEAGQEVCEVVTDKASFFIEAPSCGVLKSIFIDQGKEVLVGGLLGEIE